ncbi:MAG: (2Fe-2S)-binding protein, partial [Candidatus Binatia bacterium]
MKNGLKGARTVNIQVTVNGSRWSGEVNAEETLLNFVRDRLGLKGTKRSCESQVCGACTVLVGNQAVSSCSYLAWEAANKEILTIEGLA